MIITCKSVVSCLVKDSKKNEDISFDSAQDDCQSESRMCGKDNFS